MTHDCESHDVWLSHMTHSYESWVSRMGSASDTWLILRVMIGLRHVEQLTLTSHLMDFTLWLTLVMSFVTRSMSHGWGKNPYISAPSGHEFGFFTQPSKLLSLLLVQYTIFISLPTFRDQSVISDNDPPSTILIRVLVSLYKREVFAIKLKGYLLQVLPVRVPDCNRFCDPPLDPSG